MTFLIKQIVQALFVAKWLKARMVHRAHLNGKSSDRGRRINHIDFAINEAGIGYLRPNRT
jgi:hypothetical protein